MRVPCASSQRNQTLRDDLLAGLDDYLTRHKMAGVSDLVGSLGTGA
jgi:hypothetical protein